MLIEHDRDLLVETKTKIKALEVKLQAHDQETVVTPFQEKLKDILERYEKDIITGKRNKFHRDRTDFDTRSAFRWRHRGNKRNTKNDNMNDNTSSGNEHSSSEGDFLSPGPADSRPGGAYANTRKRGFHNPPVWKRQTRNSKKGTKD